MIENIEVQKKKKKLNYQLNNYENIELIFPKKLFKNETITNESLSEYLSSNYPFFEYIKNFGGIEKLNQLIEVLNFEVFEKNQTIINYGDECEKFYILINGLIEIYKVKPKIVEISLRDYIKYLSKIKDYEKNNSKLERIINQNPDINNYDIKKKKFNYRDIQDKRKFTVTLEENFKVAEFESNFTFGEIPIIKKEPMEQTIIALKKTIIATIDKNEYNKLIRDLEENRITEKVNNFKIKYPFFYFWPRYRICKLFNSFQKIILFKGDYLFKQNSKPEGIYFIKNGQFEINTFINFSCFENFIEYIHESPNSIINDISKLKTIPLKMLKPFIEENLKKNENNTFIFNENSKNKNLDEYENNNEIYDTSNLEKYSFKCIIKRIKSPEFIGYEECLDFKQRFTSAKCISEKAEIYKVNIDDFFQLIPFDRKSEFFMKENLREKKMYLISQVKNNVLKRINYIDEDIKENLMKLIEIENITPIKKFKLNDTKIQILCKNESAKNINLHKLPKLKLSNGIHKRINLKSNDYENQENFTPNKKNIIFSNNLLVNNNLNMKRKLFRNNSHTIKLFIQSKNFLNNIPSFSKFSTIEDKNRIKKMEFNNQTHDDLIKNSDSNIFDDKNKRKIEFRSNFNFKFN